jgi:predicted O-methyltransferase YrrM
LDEKPTFILEMGTGFSSIVAGYSLKLNRKGRLLSLENEASFAVQSGQLIEKHGLGKFVRVLHAPLREVVIGNQNYRWYDTSFLGSLQEHSIDAVFVDGPPGNIQELSRYPALPILFDYLADNVTIIVDDANRTDEKEIIYRWLHSFRCFKVKLLSTAKGTAVLTRKKQG